MQRIDDLQRDGLRIIQDDKGFRFGTDAVLLEEGRKNERAEILEKLSKGMRLKGTVSSIVDFGAFVDLGGIVAAEALFE